MDAAWFDELKAGDKVLVSYSFGATSTEKVMIVGRRTDTAVFVEGERYNKHGRNTKNHDVRIGPVPEGYERKIAAAQRLAKALSALPDVPWGGVGAFVRKYDTEQMETAAQSLCEGLLILRAAKLEEAA
jgi:hypothetical protein